MWGFCSSNAPSLSFTISIFILNLFDTWHCYYFGLNLSLVLLVKIFCIKKHVMLFFSPLKMKKLCHMSLFLCLSGISLGWYCWKGLAKIGEFRKIVKMGGIVYRVRVQFLCTLWITFYWISLFNRFSTYIASCHVHNLKVTSATKLFFAIK